MYKANVIIRAAVLPVEIPAANQAKQQHTLFADFGFGIEKEHTIIGIRRDSFVPASHPAKHQHELGTGSR